MKGTGLFVPSIISEYGNSAFSLYRLGTNGLHLPQKSVFRGYGGNLCAKPRNYKTLVYKIPSALCAEGIFHTYAIFKDSSISSLETMMLSITAERYFLTSKLSLVSIILAIFLQILLRSCSVIVC